MNLYKLRFKVSNKLGTILPSHMLLTLYILLPTAVVFLLPSLEAKMLFQFQTVENHSPGKITF